MKAKEIGGYFGLELNKGNEYHNMAIHLNTGRNCLEYLIKMLNIKKIFVPYYNCEVMLEPIKKCKVNYEFYHVDNKLAPIVNQKIKSNETLLYVNYFGLKQNIVNSLSYKYKNLIIDNSQAFYCPLVEGMDTFYSARKFFGVPDGAYLYTKKKKIKLYKDDCSSSRMQHLLIRLDEGAEKGYNNFKLAENSLNNLSIRKMSNITKALLCNINYEYVKSVREQNFLFLYEKLNRLNRIEFDLSKLVAPMVYPFFTKIKGLREKLIKNKIFLATYWRNVLNLVDRDQLEYKLVNQILPLPIDQRYGKAEMEYIVYLIKNSTTDSNRSVKKDLYL
jgi:hypothetical protein